MIELIELPYRGYGTSDTLSTELSLTLKVGTQEFKHEFGRKINLEPFASGKIFKYKTIQTGERIIERIFLLAKNISQDEEWWKEEDLYAYPIQCKNIERNNAIFGKSFKYGFGIVDYLNEHQSGVFYYPTMRDDKTVFRSIDMLWLTSAIIPAPDIKLICYKKEEFAKFIHYRDRWLSRDANFAELFEGVRVTDIGQNGLISLAQTDEIVQSAHCIDADPVENDWKFYQFAMFMNDLVVSDITITAYAKKNKLDIVLKSRYNIDYNKDLGIKELSDALHAIVFDLLNDRFKDTPWTKITICKTWSEELYFFVYEKQSPKEVSQVLYLDLVLFSLGTVGIKQQ